MYVPGNIILDLGCGEGSVAKKLKDFGCKVIGVDASQAMVDATLAEGAQLKLSRASTAWYWIALFTGLIYDSDPLSFNRHRGISNGWP